MDEQKFRDAVKAILIKYVNPKKEYENKPPREIVDEFVAAAKASMPNE